MTTRPFPAPRTRQHGAAIIEFALILTLLISIVAGIVEFGRTFWYYDALSKATRNAARALSVSNPAALSTAVDAAKESVNAAAASAGVPSFSTAKVDVQCVTIVSNVLLTGGCNFAGPAPAGVRVSIINYNVFLGSSIPFLVGSASTYSINLTPATTMPYMR